MILIKRLQNFFSAPLSGMKSLVREGFVKVDSIFSQLLCVTWSNADSGIYFLWCGVFDTHERQEFICLCRKRIQ